MSTAAGGRAALEEVAARPPAVVVLDVMMPDLDGVSVVRRMRADGVDVPVCILSARDEVDDRVAGLQAGADDYLVKPFALAELTARLNALLRRRGSDVAGPLVVGDLVIDPRRHVVTRGGRTSSRPAASSSSWRSSPAIPARSSPATSCSPGVGLRDRRRDERRRRVRRLRPAQARVGRRAAHAPHRPRGRLGAPAVSLPSSLRARITIAASSRSPSRRRGRNRARRRRRARRPLRRRQRPPRPRRAHRARHQRRRRRRLRRPGRRRRRGRAASACSSGRGRSPRSRSTARSCSRAATCPPNAPPVPAGDGFSTVRIDGHDWRSLTMPLGAAPAARGCSCCRASPRSRRAPTASGASCCSSASPRWRSRRSRPGASRRSRVRPLARLRAGRGAGERRRT